MIEGLLDIIDSIIYEPGFVKMELSGMVEARRNRFFRNVQIKLWKKGEQGYKRDRWVNMDESWWHRFVREV